MGAFFVLRATVKVSDLLSISLEVVDEIFDAFLVSLENKNGAMPTSLGRPWEMFQSG